MNDEDRVSECCGALLVKYNRKWMDGVCSKCDKHSPSINNVRNKKGELNGKEKSSKPEYMDG